MRCRPGPALIKLDKEEWVLEGPPIDDCLQQVDNGHDHEANEEEGEKGSQVVPGHPNSIAQATEPTLVGSVGGAAGRVWSRSAVCQIVTGV